MAVIKKKRVRWTAGMAADIVGHKLYVEQAPAEPTSGSQSIIVDMPETEVILPDAFPPGTFDADANYNLGVASVDDVGNESDIVMVSVPFDFVAPDAPTDIVVENI